MEKLKKIKEHWVLITFFVSIISSLFWFMHSVLNKYDEILGTIQTTQQMALKSVIWNDEIPIAERASACDVYLNAGYNSLTKKECETVINKGVDNGIFSYVEREVKENDNRINIWTSPSLSDSYLGFIHQKR